MAAFAAVLAGVGGLVAAPAFADGPGYGGDANQLHVTIVGTPDAPAPSTTTLPPAPTVTDAPATDAAPVATTPVAGGPGRSRRAVMLVAARRSGPDAAAPTDPAKPARPTALRLEARGFLAGSPLNVVVPGSRVAVHADRFGALDAVVTATSRHGRVRVRGVNADLDTRALSATIPTGSGAGRDPRPLVFGALALVGLAIAATPFTRRALRPTPTRSAGSVLLEEKNR